MEVTLAAGCETSYEDIDSLIHSIAIRVAGKNRSEMIDDLVAEGWVIVLESLPKYVPERGIKLTTYLWTAVNGGLIRMAQKGAAVRLVQTLDSGCMRGMSTEQVTHSGMFLEDPYKLQPDMMYEKRERLTLWRQLNDEFGQDISDLLEKAPRKQDVIGRKAVSRYRRRKLSRLQAQVKQMLSQPACNEMNLRVNDAGRHFAAKSYSGEYQ